MLRTRLFLNLVPFVLILLAVGIYGILLFSRLAGDVDQAVKKNYRSVVAAQTMDLAIERMQAGVLWAFENTRELGRQIFEENSRIFSTNLATQIQNVTSDEERALTEKLGAGIRSLHTLAGRIFNEEQRTERERLYNVEFYPLITQLSSNLKTIRDLNHQAILQTNVAASLSVEEVTRLMILGLVIALLLSSYACYQLGRAILTPIQDLTRASQVLGRGDLENPVPVNSSDELGQLAVAFNTMAAQLHEYRQSTSDRIVRLHRTMETALASFPDPIFVLDKAGEIELKNPSASLLAAEFGADRTLPARLQEIVSRVLRGSDDYVPNSFNAAVHLTLKGTEKFFLPRIVHMRGRENEIVGLAVVLYDITRFRLLDDAKSNLVATVSHELKTPLTGIRMALHLLAESHLGGLTPKQRDLVMTARNDTEKLLRILNDLLDLTRLEEGKTGLQLELAEPGALIEAAIGQLRDAARAKSIEIRGEVSDATPPVRVDRQRLNHVFSNFINNAIKYSPPGGTILVRAATADGNTVRFSVLDQGPGIADQHKHRVFDRFYRVPGQTKTGAGLGLSIAREIVLAHGGRIGVRDGDSGGSEFFFALPAEAVEPAERAPGTISQPTAVRS